MPFFLTTATQAEIDDYFASTGNRYLISEMRERFHDEALTALSRVDANTVLHVRAQVRFAASAHDLHEIAARGNEYQRQYPLAWTEPTEPRWASMSATHPSKVAYYRDMRSAYEDRRTVVTVGTYLDRFHADIPAAERERRLTEHAVQFAQFGTLRITTDPAEIVHAYTSAKPTAELVAQHPTKSAARIQSCMTERFPGHRHPVSAYGLPGDLALAYLGPLSGIHARAIIWPDKKVFYRHYGVDAITTLLKAEGYTDGSLAGARIARVAVGDDWLMPYIDGIGTASPSACGQFWVLGEYKNCHVSVRCDGTGGVQRPEAEQAHERNCDHCDNEFESDDDSASYCPSCQDARFNCDVCSEDSFDEGTTYYVRGAARTACEVCCENADGVWDCACGVDITHEVLTDPDVRTNACAGLLLWCSECRPFVGVCPSAVHQPVRSYALGGGVGYVPHTRTFDTRTATQCPNCSLDVDGVR